VKRKKSGSNYDTKQCKNCTVQRMAFKGTITFLQLNDIGIQNFKGRKVLCKNHLSSPLNQAVKGLISWKKHWLMA
jgi:hypothetical protein